MKCRVKAWSAACAWHLHINRSASIYIYTCGASYEGNVLVCWHASKIVHLWKFMWIAKCAHHMYIFCVDVWEWTPMDFNYAKVIFFCPRMWKSQKCPTFRKFQKISKMFLKIRIENIKKKLLIHFCGHIFFYNWKYVLLFFLPSYFFVKTSITNYFKYFQNIFPSWGPHI